MSASTRRTDLAARARAVTAGSPAPAIPTASSTGVDTASGTPRPLRTGNRAPRATPVRITVDLSPVEHRTLRDWCSAAAVDLGMARIPAAEVVRVLLERLTDDEGLAEQVRADLDDRRA